MGRTQILKTRFKCHRDFLRERAECRCSVLNGNDLFYKLEKFTRECLVAHLCNKKTSTEWQIQMQRIPKVLLDPDPFFIAPYPILAGSIGKEDTKF